MSASDNLSRSLFHGTTAKLKPGDVILPRSKTGESSVFDSAPGKRRAFAVEDLQTAKWFAAQRTAPWRGSRAHVYEVEPVGETKLRNLQTSKRPGTEAIVEHSSKEGFRVKKRVWSRTLSQGDTGLAWNQKKKPFTESSDTHVWDKKKRKWIPKNKRD